jgi:hypothetical protein
MDLSHLKPIPMDRDYETSTEIEMIQEMLNGNLEMQNVTQMQVEILMKKVSQLELARASLEAQILSLTNEVFSKERR